MKVIFLDIDWVIHIDGSNTFDPECCSFVKEIVNQTGAKIIVSSAWGFSVDLRHIALKQFQQYGLPIEGFTTIVNPIEDDKVANIKHFLDTHDVEQWVVIDDFRLSIDNLIHISSKNGLDLQAAKQAIAKLK